MKKQIKQKDEISPEEIKSTTKSTNIVDSTLEKEMKNSYLEYAMNVITARAIPNVRDGIKHVQRRILYSMYRSNFTHNNPINKSAKVTGEVSSKYHPHSDVLIYDCMVRLVQPFNCNHPLLQGQGNFGSIDGDSAADKRYTGLRMSKFGGCLLDDIDKNTVAFRPNYDGTEMEPIVLPSKVPTLLINGCNGIAVGFATSYPPHNLADILDATIMLVRNENTSMDDLINIVKAPDFPTGGVVHIDENTHDIYRYGKGSFILRSKVYIDDDNTIHITELPYQVNKSQLVAHIAELVNNYQIKDVADVSDDSEGVKVHIVIKVKPYANPHVILNNLYSMTKIQTPVYANCVALDGKNPKLFNLKEALEIFIKHRLSVVYKRSEYMLQKTVAKLYNLISILVAIESVEEVISILKCATSNSDAKKTLCERSFALSGDTLKIISKLCNLDLINKSALKDSRFVYDEQSINPVLEIRLSALTRLEHGTLCKNIEGLITDALYYRELITCEQKRKDTVITELNEIRSTFGRPRLTNISHVSTSLKEEDFIVSEEVFITLSRAGYIKSQKISGYSCQKRGGTGKSFVSSGSTKDYLEHTILCNRRDTLKLFSNKGKLYWLKACHIPLIDKQRGKPLKNLIPLQDDERITSILQTQENNDQDIIFVTKHGIVKKTRLSNYSKPRSNGLIYIVLKDKDEVVHVTTSKDLNSDLMLVSHFGRACRFKLSKARRVGRAAIGVKGINLVANDYVVGCMCLEKDNEASVCLVTNNGKGRITPLSLYPVHNRGTKGVNLFTNKQHKAGHRMICALRIDKKNYSDAELITSTYNGLINRIPVKSIPVYKSRMTIGVNIINLHKKDKLVSANMLLKKQEDEETY